MDTINLKCFIKKIGYSLFFLTIIISCKKKDNTVDNNTNVITPVISELSNPIFEFEYGNCYDYQDIGNNPLTVLSTNDLIVSSIEYDGNVDKLQISKLNANGLITWQKNFTQGYKFMAGNSFETSTNNVIIIGTLINQSDWTKSKVFIAKLNILTGDTIWTKSYGHNYIDIGVCGFEDVNNNYWIVDFSQQNHKATLINLSSNGDSLTSIINNETTPPTYEDALITSNKNVIMTGESGNTTSGKTPVYICSYSENGIKNFSSDITLTNYDEIKVNDICEMSDGNYCIAGECYNFSNTSLRYGFLLKVDNNGNKIWEKILTQFNGSSIYSCIEKQSNILYLGVGGSGNAKLYKYDLSSLTAINTNYATSFNDIQLVFRNSKLYRALIDIKTSGYETVKIKAYTVN